MSFKPDYGLRQLHEGVSREVDQFFYNFQMSSLSFLGEDQYSTMVEMTLGGEFHALSLDFNKMQLDQILSKAPPHISSFIQKELSSDPSTPRTIDFKDEIAFGVRARLGMIQNVQRESFVPLVAQEIF